MTMAERRFFRFFFAMLRIFREKMLSSRSLGCCLYIQFFFYHLDEPKDVAIARGWRVVNWEREKGNECFQMYVNEWNPPISQHHLSNSSSEMELIRFFSENYQSLDRGEKEDILHWNRRQFDSRRDSLDVVRCCRHLSLERKWKLRKWMSFVLNGIFMRIQFFFSPVFLVLFNSSSSSSWRDVGWIYNSFNLKIIS